jgi:hypothetical protein
MIVAMISVRMMQMAIDQIVDVITMRHRFVAASGPMDVVSLMPRASMLRRARIRIDRRNLDDMLVDVTSVHVMQVPIVQIVDVVAMLNRDVPATRSVLMRVIGVLWVRAGGHSDVTPQSIVQQGVASSYHGQVAKYYSSGSRGRGPRQ